jgi:hypothetical protein
MPTAAQHLRQRDSNRRLLNEPVLQGGAYCDWQITIAFYVAVHHVEEALARLHNEHSAHHADRFRRILQHWPLAYDPLQVLYRRSLWARYDCRDCGPADVRQAVAALQTMQALVT